MKNKLKGIINYERYIFKCDIYRVITTIDKL